VSLVTDVQPASKHATRKIRMHAGAACLITDMNLCGAHVRCNPPQKLEVKGRAYGLTDSRANSEATGVPGAHSLAARSK